MADAGFERFDSLLALGIIAGVMMGVGLSEQAQRSASREANCCRGNGEKQRLRSSHFSSTESVEVIGETECGRANRKDSRGREMPIDRQSREFGGREYRRG